jgi:16S rRNA (cytosine1402-N4)-methyltransferase
MPFVPAGHEAKFTLVTRGAEMATDDEVEDNSRARSVRLRVVERTTA